MYHPSVLFADYLSRAEVVCIVAGSIVFSILSLLCSARSIDFDGGLSIRKSYEKKEVLWAVRGERGRCEVDAYGVSEWMDRLWVGRWVGHCNLYSPPHRNVFDRG